MQRGNMNEENEISESETSEMFSNLKTMEERVEAKIKMLLDLKTTDEIIEAELKMLSNMKNMEERAMFRRKRDQQFFEASANIGLAQYNAQNGTNFQLDKISCEDHYYFPGAGYFHVNFIAESSDGSNNEKKRLMFFAEVVGFTESVVSVCCILDPVAGMESGCEFCDRTVYHPSGVRLGPPQLEKRKSGRK